MLFCKFFPLFAGVTAMYEEILYRNFSFNSYPEGLMIPSIEHFFQAIGIRPKIFSIELYRSFHEVKVDNWQEENETKLCYIRYDGTDSPPKTNECYISQHKARCHGELIPITEEPRFYFMVITTDRDVYILCSDQHIGRPFYKKCGSNITENDRVHEINEQKKKIADLLNENMHLKASIEDSLSAREEYQTRNNTLEFWVKIAVCVLIISLFVTVILLIWKWRTANRLQIDNLQYENHDNYISGTQNANVAVN